jgi:arylsulfatase A-like enzyme
MSGQYPARIGITDFIAVNEDVHPQQGKLIDAPNDQHLPHSGTSLAGALGERGYATYHVGKWHLGGAAEDSLPTDHGFDENVAGCEWGRPMNGYFAPWGIPTLEEGPADEGRYLPDRLAEEAVSLIEESAGSEEPFFLNYDPYLVHTPIEAPDGVVERYEQKRASLGLDDVTEFEFGDRFPYEDGKDARIRRRLVQSDPGYAAMVEALDRVVGRVLDALERTGLAENTVVVFTSDNGGLATTSRSPTTNRPLAEGKGWMNEGGNRVPFIVRWPGVTDDPDAPDLIETPVTSPDVYPTLLDAAGVPLPEEPIDGESLRPLLADPDGGLDRDAIFWHYPHYGNQGCTPAAAVRQGDWKLIEFLETGHTELYHLGEDLSEDQDLRKHRPETATRLRERLAAWQDDVGARFPAENPEFEPWPDRASPE